MTKDIDKMFNMPEDQTCPICNMTNSHAPSYLIPVVGTSDEGISEAKCVHVICALEALAITKEGVIVA